MRTKTLVFPFVVSAVLNAGATLVIGRPIARGAESLAPEPFSQASVSLRPGSPGDEAPPPGPTTDDTQARKPRFPKRSAVAPKPDPAPTALAQKSSADNPQG